MSEIWSSDELMVNMGSFSDTVTEHDSLLSTWLSHAIQSDDNSTGIEYNMFGKYEGCEMPIEVYATIGAYLDVSLSPYIEKSLNYECSDNASGSMEIGRTSPQYNLVGSNEYIYSSLQDPKSISSYLHEGCMNSCPSDQSRDTSVSSSSSSPEQKDSHVKVHRNANVDFPVGFDGCPFATAEAFHSCEDWMENMLSASSMPEHSFSSLPAYNNVMQNVIEGEIEVAWNSEKVDEVLKSKSGGDGPICYVNQLQLENKSEERYQIPINDVVVEEQHPPLKRHCSERLMADRAKVNALPAIEERINYMTMSSSSSMLASIEPTLSSIAGTAFNTDGKPRARRGSATDPQSLYARRRREKINERLKVLQNLIPNGTKVDISTMLEDAIHYVKFLQLQIKILSSDDHWMQAPIAFHALDASFGKPSTCQ